jgi:hypothetical protein
MRGALSATPFFVIDHMKQDITLHPPRSRPQPRFDLLDLPLLGRFLRWKHARTALQIPLFAVALLMIWDGLTGPQLAPRNVATVLTWVQYRGVLVFALLAAGNLFCMACPFMLPRNLARRFFRPARMVPRRFRSKWLAVVLLALFLFVYELFDLWATPWWTAWLIIGYFAAALIVDSLFTGAAFCKYVCPIGQFNFMAATVSPLEVNVRNADVCATCRTKDCIKGRDDQRGCELWLFQPRKVGNLDCTFCLDCVHACPHDNVGIGARLPASELWRNPFRSGVGQIWQRRDLTALALVFTFGALVNAFGMVTPVYALQEWLGRVLSLQAEAPILGIIFAAGLIVEPLVLLGAAAGATQRWSGLRQPLIEIALRYAWALVPLGFGIWLAHYGFHFLTGAWTIVPVLQTLFADYGWPLLGTPRWDLGALVPTALIYPAQFGFIMLGGFGSLLSAYEIARHDAPKQPLRVWWPWAVLLVLLAIAALWLMAQPMEMRGTVFSG